MWGIRCASFYQRIASFVPSNQQYPYLVTFPFLAVLLGCMNYHLLAINLFQGKKNHLAINVLVCTCDNHLAIPKVVKYQQNQTVRQSVISSVAS